MPRQTIAALATVLISFGLVPQTIVVEGNRPPADAGREAPRPARPQRAHLWI